MPTSGQCKTWFATSLAGLMSAATQQSFWPEGSTAQMSLFVQESSVIYSNRATLVARALQDNATHILFLDDDMIFTPKAVSSVISRNKDVVITNYPMKVFPIQPTVVTKDDKGALHITEDSTGIEEVFFGGFGLSLFNTEVFKTIPEPWFLPLWLENKKAYTTEDIPFFIKLKEHGFKVWCDLDASKELGHIGTYTWSWKT